MPSSASVPAVILAASLGGTGLLASACSASKDSSTSPSLARLELSDAELSPEFSPEITEYRAEVGLLGHSVEVLAESEEAGASIALGQRPMAAARLSETVELGLGDNALTLVVRGPAGGERSYSVTVERREEPWRAHQVLTAELPSEDAFFGDYLRASRDRLYVNASRRGRLYRREADEWVFDRLSEELFSVELEWMYEATISEDALAVVAQPAGGVEAVFAFTRDGSEWVSAGEFEVGTQGTLRLWGDDLVFVTSDGISFFRREAGQYRLAQTLSAPAENVGFGERPTYFDAPGVDLDEDTLIVGAPRDSSPATGIDGSPEQDCATQAERCAFESGAVFVYERSEGTWEQTAYLKPPEAAERLEFGTTAALDGGVIVVGCSREGSTLEGASTELSAVVCSGDQNCRAESGAVFVYIRDAGSWREHVMLKSSRPRAYDYFGDTVLLSDDVLLVGAPGQDSAAGASLDDTSQEDSGGVFAFLKEPDGFRELGLYKLDASAVFPFPATLELSGIRLVVASNQAPFRDASGQDLLNAGLVYYLY